MSGSIFQWSYFWGVCEVVSQCIDGATGVEGRLWGI